MRKILGVVYFGSGIREKASTHAARGGDQDLVQAECFDSFERRCVHAEESCHLFQHASDGVVIDTWLQGASVAARRQSLVGLLGLEEQIAVKVAVVEMVAGAISDRPLERE